MSLITNFKLRDDLRAACDFAITNPGEVEKIYNRVAGKNPVTIDYKSLGDEDILDGFALATNPPPFSNEVRIDDLATLEEAICFIQTQYPANVPNFEEYLRAVAFDAAKFAEHEGDHARVTSLIGFDCSFSLIFFRYEQQEGLEFVATVRAFNPKVPVTKLGVASCFVAPVEPSDSDIAKLKLLGYRDVKDVGERVLNYNERGNFPELPLPRSFQPQYI